MEGELVQMVKVAPTVIIQEPVVEGVSGSMRYAITTSIKLYLSPAEFRELVDMGYDD
jgi:hypothetical protein